METLSDTKRSIRFTEATVIKQGSPEQIRVEVEKNIKARSISESCELFTVPKIIDYDNHKGIVVFERIRNISKLWRVAFTLGLPQRQALFTQIGQSLAAIHKDLCLPQNMVVNLPGKLDQFGEKVFIHGDFAGINICVKPTDPSQIVIFDWCMSDLLGGRATWGSRYFDLFWLIWTVFRIRPANSLWSDPVSGLARKLVSDYCEASGIDYNQKELSAYAHLLFSEVGYPKPKFRVHRLRTYKNRLVAHRMRLKMWAFVDSL